MTANPAVEVTLRIPGNWEHPAELVERIPDGYRLTGEHLLTPDDQEIDIVPHPPDDQFFDIFRRSCRQAPTADELKCAEDYTVNVCLAGPGGSLDSARTMMHAGAAIVSAGGAGVFVDNSGLAHGGRAWLGMCEDGGSDALSFAYVGIVSGRQEVWTMGMHVLGFPDLLMPVASPYSSEGETIVDVLRYVCASDQSVDDGHLLAVPQGLRWKAVATTPDDLPTSHPMHNPFGRLKLVSLQGMAENN